MEWHHCRVEWLSRTRFRARWQSAPYTPARGAAGHLSAGRSIRSMSAISRLLVPPATSCALDARACWSSPAIRGRRRDVVVAPAEARGTRWSRPRSTASTGSKRRGSRSTGPVRRTRSTRSTHLQSPDRELFLIVGSDVAASLDTWVRVDELRELRDARRRRPRRQRAGPRRRTGGAPSRSRCPGSTSRRATCGDGSRRASRSISSSLGGVRVLRARDLYTAP